MLTVDPTYYRVFVKMEENLMRSQIFHGIRLHSTYHEANWFGLRFVLTTFSKNVILCKH